MNTCEQIKENLFNNIRRWYLHVFSESKLKVVTPEGLMLKCAISSDDKSENEKKEKESKPQNQRGWEREEMVLLVAEYFRTRDLEPKKKKRSIKMISKVLRNRAIMKGEIISDTFRNENGIQMQTACLIKYDPELMRTKEKYGLSGGSKLMVQIVKEYIGNSDKIKAEAYETLTKYNQEEG